MYSNELLEISLILAFNRIQLNQQKNSNQISPEEVFNSLSQEEQQAVLAIRSTKEYPKGTLLLSEGDRIHQSLYVLEGCVRKFKLVDGEDKTSFFYVEEQSIMLPPVHDLPVYSKFNLECLEDSKILMVSIEKEREFSARFPRFERMCRLETEKSLVEFQDFFAKFISSSPTERYQDLVENNPELLARVPQYHLASYLGVTPESLSRIRKRLIGKKA